MGSKTFYLRYDHLAVFLKWGCYGNEMVSSCEKQLNIARLPSSLISWGHH